MNTDAPAWKLDRDADGIAWLTLDKPGSSANVLSRDTLAELGSLAAGARRRPTAAVVVRSGKSSGFMAGADIKEFTALKNATEAYGLIRAGQQVLDRLEVPPLPHRGRHPRLCARRRTRARARLPLSRRASTMSACRSGLPEVHARHPSGLRRHGALGASASACGPRWT